MHQLPIFRTLQLILIGLALSAARSPQKVPITSENRSDFRQLGSWICRDSARRLGTLRRGAQLTPGAVFLSLKYKRKRRGLRRRMRELSRSRSKGEAQLKRLAALKSALSELTQSWTQCSTGEPAPTPTGTPGPNPEPTATPGPSPEPTATPTATPTPPTPTPTPPGWIHNPYYEAPTWKLWGEDQAPVTLNDQQSPLPATAAERVFPDIAGSNPWPGQFLALTSDSSQAAGFWDDAYKSEDNAHTMIRTSWRAGAASINLSGQFIRLNIGDYGASPANNQLLGINFTSQSTTCMGHNLVSGYQVAFNERSYYFANTLRGGPSYYSFRDHRAERTIDSYTALPVSGFHSFGRSGSETNGLLKMLVAGGHLPRSLKDQLKRAGLYPSALLYIYKAALPYANADGTAVDFANELRHRPGYLSNGGTANSEFMPYNQWYHRYDEGQHFYTMTQLAGSMSVAPPLAILELLEGVRRQSDGSESAISTGGAGKTIVQAPLNPGETVTLKVDVGSSFDLAGRPLTFEWQILYPEQQNVTITQESATVYNIQAAHSPALPKGRIPILLTASNGIFHSNPAVVSFYPGSHSVSCSNYQLGADPDSEVNVNNRPIFTSSAGGEVVIAAGQTAAFTLQCSDPEGFTTRYYRWLGEPGTLHGNDFSLPTAPTDAGKTFALHFICSDGTGAYNSLEQKVVVQ